MVNQAIANKIKDVLTGVEQDLMLKLQIKQYKILSLIDDAGNWVDQKLEKISDQLINQNCTEEDCRAYVDQIAENSFSKIFI